MDGQSIIAVLLFVLMLAVVYPIWVFGLTWMIGRFIASLNRPFALWAWIFGHVATFASCIYSRPVSGGGCVICGGGQAHGWPFGWIGVAGVAAVLQPFYLMADIVLWSLAAWLLYRVKHYQQGRRT